MTGGTPPAPPAPVEIGSFPLNSKDLVRAALDQFNGQPIVNFRKWFRGDDGTDRPTKKGIAFAVRHLPAFVALANDALARARAHGLLPTPQEAEQTETERELEFSRFLTWLDQLEPDELAQLHHWVRERAQADKAADAGPLQ